METGEHITAETAQELDESNEVDNMKKVEAALFLSARYLTLQDLVMLTDINPLMIRELIDKLIERYNSDQSSIEIVVKEDMWKMDVGQEYVNMVNKLATGSAEFSKTEQETLAVIAYKQPVKQSVIIKIRGNKSYDHIKHFIEIGLVQAKKAGRTKELKLSDDFFEYFHLQKKRDGSGEIIGIEKMDGSSESKISSEQSSESAVDSEASKITKENINNTQNNNSEDSVVSEESKEEVKEETEEEITSETHVEEKEAEEEIPVEEAIEDIGENVEEVKETSEEISEETEEIKEADKEYTEEEKYEAIEEEKEEVGEK